MVSAVVQSGLSQDSFSPVSSKSSCSLNRNTPMYNKSRSPLEQQEELSPSCSPQLIAATSEELGPNLVPSISNISLLSLNQQPTTFTNTENQPAVGSNNINRVTNTRQRNLRGSINQVNPVSFAHLQTQIQGQIPSPTTHSSFSNRKPSMNSPTLSSIRRSSFVNSNISRKNSSTNELYEPDSPPLQPISIAGSPSNFLLSQNSPPSSLKSHMGSYLMSNHSRFILKTRRLSQNQPQVSLNTAQLTRAINKFTVNDDQQPLSLSTMGRTDSLTNSLDGKSPNLLPVSSNLPPMTPLNLSIMPELSMRSNSQVVFDEDENDEELDSEQNNHLYSNGIIRNHHHGSNCSNIEDDVFGEKLDE